MAAANNYFFLKKTKKKNGHTEYSWKVKSKNNKVIAQGGGLNRKPDKKYFEKIGQIILTAYLKSIK